ncbi:MAG: RAMP superfamily CRISPR-associated protein, partial [Leptospiraceae bacterium]|nr:RAMP superfamily CRISPR-associated protein [Leptospiraceae bacterium]
MIFKGYIDYEIILEEISSSINPRISGDTLFGKFCWIYREIYGEDRLRELLREHINNPILIFSGIFPKDYVPMPVYIPTLSEFSAIEYIDYDLHKTLKKEMYLRFDDLEAIFNSRVDLKKVQRNSIRLREIHRIQVSISRNTGTAIEGSLYTTKETRFGTDLWVFLRIRKDFLDEKELNQILKIMFETGIGAKKSSGKGMYRIKEFCKTTRLVPNENKNAFVSLNRWIPSKDDPNKGYYR